MVYNSMEWIICFLFLKAVLNNEAKRGYGTQA